MLLHMWCMHYIFNAFNNSYMKRKLHASQAGLLDGWL